MEDASLDEAGLAVGMTGNRTSDRLDPLSFEGLKRAVTLGVAMMALTILTATDALADRDVLPEVRTEASVIAELEAQLRARDAQTRAAQAEMLAMRAKFEQMLDKQRAVIAEFLVPEAGEPAFAGASVDGALDVPAVPAFAAGSPIDAVRPLARPQTLAALSHDAWATLQTDDDFEEILGWVMELERRLERAEMAHDALVERSGEAQRTEARLRWRVELLESQLAQIRANIADASEPVRSFVDEEMGRITAALRDTGLDTRKLIARFAAQESAQGGPFLPFEVDDGAVAVPEYAYLAPAGVDLSFKSDLELFHQTTKLLEHLPLAAPLAEYRQSSGFGSRRDPINGRRAFHAGTDYLADAGSAILATGPGTVIHAASMGAFGRLIEIDHGGGIVSRYAHLSEMTVEEGQRVERGQKIGVIGRSGRTTGTHLHYEIRVDGEPLNPARLVNAGLSLAHVLGN